MLQRCTIQLSLIRALGSVKLSEVLIPLINDATVSNLAKRCRAASLVLPEA